MLKYDAEITYMQGICTLLTKHQISDYIMVCAEHMRCIYIVYALYMPSIHSYYGTAKQ